MKKKYQFLYPAIFVKDESENRVQVIFPDLNIYTDGKNMTEAYFFAKSLLKVYFSYAIKYDVDYNKPTKAENLLARCKSDEIVMYVDTTVEA